jgi:hypothetical protein
MNSPELPDSWNLAQFLAVRKCDMGPYLNDGWEIAADPHLPVTEWNLLQPENECVLLRRVIE